MADCFGGSTGEENSLEAQTSSLSKTLESNYTQAFADQGDALKQLQSEISQIQSGQTGPGFGAAELAAKTGQIVNQAGANARNVEQAEANQSAGQIYNGAQDSSGLARASAIRQQLTGEAQSAAETQKSNALENLTSQNYAQGRSNAAQTAGGLEALSGAYGGRAEQSLSGSMSAANTAFDEDNEIRKQEAARQQAIAGLVEKGVMTAATFGAGGIGNLDTAGTSTFGEQVGNIFSGGMSALSGG